MVFEAVWEDLGTLVRALSFSRGRAEVKELNSGAIAARKLVEGRRRELDAHASEVLRAANALADQARSVAHFSDTAR